MAPNGRTKGPGAAAPGRRGNEAVSRTVRRVGLGVRGPLCKALESKFCLGPSGGMNDE